MAETVRNIHDSWCIGRGANCEALSHCIFLMLRDDEGCFAACMNWLLGDTAARWRRFVPFCHMAHANSPVGPIRGRAWIDAETGKAEDGPRV